MLKIFALKIFAVCKNIIGMDFKHFCSTVVREEVSLFDFRAKEGKNYYLIYV